MLLFKAKFRSSAAKLSNKLSAGSIVEELFEEGSAMLAERLEFCFLYASFITFILNHHACNALLKDLL